MSGIKRKIVRYKDVTLSPNDRLSVEIIGDEDNSSQIRISGTKNGLEALAKIILNLSAMVPDHYDIPKGAFLHEHLFPGTRLSANSIPLEICQKDPKE